MPSILINATILYEANNLQKLDYPLIQLLKLVVPLTTGVGVQVTDFLAVWS